MRRSQAGWPDRRRAAASLATVAALSMIMVMMEGAAVLKTQGGPDPEPLSLALQLPDGPSFRVGREGLGRPFLARLILRNGGDRPLVLWDPTNSEGAQCPGIRLEPVDGDPIELRPPPIPRLAGRATSWTIPPGRSATIDLELLRLIDPEAPPAPGTYRILAIYENDLAGASTIRGVWTGSLRSAPVTMVVVDPVPLEPPAPADPQAR